ncbi:FAD-dependent oxidoreductase [Shewanella marina]|uniref:FAD-dependent oxidoreductase n=1 Tax=Shewanella marina TaxID=487319 RepID=UPI00046ED283|nr:FAD-dependent oxidoreductase [Shewanella marina]
MQQYDVVVIGAGINGVAISQFAAAQGYSVALLEKTTVASQTSANSSKLIHGGLRYLETGAISLVHQSLQQRQYLFDHAKSLVKPVKFYIPIYKNSQRGALKVGLGLALYQLLSQFHACGRFIKVPASQWPKLGIKLAGLTEVYQYWDGQTDDRLLTQAISQSAVNLGTDLIEHCQVEQIKVISDGYQIDYQQQQQAQTLQTKTVVNCAGPWVNEVLAKVIPAVNPVAIDWVQGAHLLFDITAPDGVLYLESHLDQRVIFVMPWYGKTLVGTTETTLSELPKQPSVTDAERDYLLSIYQFNCQPQLSKVELTQKIVKEFAGIRVLPKQGQAAFDRSRELILQQAVYQPNLLTVCGGKLTTHRHTAEQVLQWLQPLLGPRIIRADINSLSLDDLDRIDDLSTETG